MKSFYVLALLLLTLPLTALAQQTVTCGWEGSETILGNDGDILASIETTSPIYNGTQSLKLVDDAISGTPNAFVGWVTGLDDGDKVAVTVWRFDDTPGSAPSCRLWARWNDDPSDINIDDGSASGQSDYGPGTGWDMTEYEWTVADGHTGIVITIRTYSNAGDTVWIDDLTVIAPSTATIIVPSDTIALERQSWAGIKTSF